MPFLDVIKGFMLSFIITWSSTKVYHLSMISQPGFGYQQQLVPGMRPNYFVPMVQPGQQNQRPGGRRSGTGPMQQAQQPIPLMQPRVGVI